VHTCPLLKINPPSVPRLIRLQHRASVGLPHKSPGYPCRSILVIKRKRKEPYGQTTPSHPTGYSISKLKLWRKTLIGERSCSKSYHREPWLTLAASYVYIGVRPKASSLDSLPGFDSTSWGYHGDDGGIFHDSENLSSSESFGLGDTVGCGFDSRDRTLFFTRNGLALGEQSCRKG
jgi:hypothetical protein